MIATLAAVLAISRMSDARITPRAPSEPPPGGQNCSITLEPAVTSWKGGDSVTCDLDGNGTPENIVVLFNPDGWSFTLRINHFSVSGSGAGLNETFAIVDVDTLDGLREIAVTESGADDNVTHFYGFDGSRIFSMGSIEGSGDIRVDGSGLLRARKRGEILQIWSYPTLHRLNPEHRFERIEMELYPMNTPVKLKKPLQLVRSRSNPVPALLLEAGEKAVILSSDDVGWCLVRNSAGATGWFSIDSEGRLGASRQRPEDLFEGLKLE
jgi:hypothetical protein